MTEQEKKMLDMLKTSEENVLIPKSLEPENIEKMLLEKKKAKKKVWWKNTKVYGAMAASLILAFGLGNFALQTTKSDNLTVESKIATAESYQDVYKIIKKYQKSQHSFIDSVVEGLSFGTKEESADMAAPESSSGTNVRTEGVGEADIVKTDGKYLYVLQDSGREINIVDVSTDHMKAVTEIYVDEDSNIIEFYVNDTYLYIFIDTWENTMVETYDLKDIENPEKIGTIKQSGCYHTSRIADGFIYTFSNYYVHLGNGGAAVEDYIPKINGAIVPEDDIFLPENPACQYVVVTSMDMKNPKEIFDQKAILTNAGEVYASTENIYIYESTRYTETPCKTAIRKLSYKGGKLKGVAQGSVNGWINDSFSIDEYKGNLRVVTTEEHVETTTNSVYVLDENLEIIGEINGIAKDERVYSARLFGDTGYFVTYRETDPLFSVDFSDPTNPTIIGKLKIPGFSEYLHFYGEDQLVGIGMDTEEKTGITNGMKVSMFDISDPSDVKEVHTHTIEDAYSSDLFWNYKAVLVDYDKNMIGFSCYKLLEEYYVFSYDAENGFKEEMCENVKGSTYLSTRGVYIGECLYIVKGSAIESYSIDTFEKIDDILL